MSDPSVFENANTNVSTPNYDEMLANIKNEKGEQKYANLGEALKALQNAQDYIPKLHQEIDGLKNKTNTLEEQYSNALSASEKLDALLKEQQELKQSIFDTKKEEEPPPVEDVPDPAPQLNEDDLYNKFRARMAEEENARNAEQNVKLVENQIVSLYGDKAVDYLRSKSQELGMSVQDLMELSGRSPKAAMNLLGVQPTAKGNFNVDNKYNSGNLKTYEDSEIRRNKGTLVGADTATLKAEFTKAGTMAQQLREKGLTMQDLSDPKNYFKLFNN